MAVICLYYISSYNKEDGLYGITDTEDSIEEFYTYNDTLLYLNKGISIKGAMQGKSGEFVLHPVYISKSGKEHYKGYLHSEPEYDNVLLIGRSTTAYKTFRLPHMYTRGKGGTCGFMSWSSNRVHSPRTGCHASLELSDGNMLYYKYGDTWVRSLLADFSDPSELRLSVPVDYVVSEFGSVEAVYRKYKGTYDLDEPELRASIGFPEFMVIKGVYSGIPKLSEDDRNRLERLGIDFYVASTSVFDREINALTTSTGVLSESFVILDRDESDRGILYNVLIRDKYGVRRVKKMRLIDIINVRDYAFPEVRQVGDGYIVSSLSGVHTYSDTALQYYYPKDYIGNTNRVRHTRNLLLGNRTLFYDLKPDGTAINIRHADGERVMLKSPITRIPKGAIVSECTGVYVIEDSITHFSSDPFKYGGYRSRFVLNTNSLSVVSSVCKCALRSTGYLELTEGNVGYALRCLVHQVCTLKSISLYQLKSSVTSRITVRDANGTIVDLLSYPVNWGLILRDVYMRKDFFNQFAQLVSTDIDFKSDMYRAIVYRLSTGTLQFNSSMNISDSLEHLDKFIDVFSTVENFTEHLKYTDADDFNFTKAMCNSIRRKLDSRITEFANANGII